MAQKDSGGKLTLRQQQSRFVKMVGLLFAYADMLGYELTLGDCFRDERCRYGHPRSLHKSRRAIDLNVFKDGRYLQGAKAAEAHSRLHDFWDFIGGNPRIEDDLNHYSFSQGGRVR